ncbi:MAG: phosphate acyltransferase PlsX [Cryptosporangiaceae bacterium]|nr:phosphate acyltransferase PlsX [Cryptosporangiaceae bacterium]
MTASEPQPVRIAVDLLGGDEAPAVVVDGVLTALDIDPLLTVLLAAPRADAERAIASAPRGSRARLSVAPAGEAVAMEGAALAVRAQEDATVRVALRALRDGAADGVVTIGSTGAAIAAAVLDLGRLPDVERPALAVVVPSSAGPLVLLDVGAGIRADPSLLVDHGLLGAAYAVAVLGIDVPRLGLLSTGTEVGKGGPGRREAAERLAAACAGLPVTFVGNVEGQHVPLGGPADVVVTDGLVGNALLKGIEGSIEMIRRRTGMVPGFARDAGRAAVLLGVPGTVIVGHGAADGEDVAACVGLAAESFRHGTGGAVSERYAEFVRGRGAIDLTESPEVVGR